MTKYIDKDALVAEIERRKKEAESNCGGYKVMMNIAVILV